jgi:hypothetical protein
MMKGSGGVYAGFPWHERKIADESKSVNLYFYGRPQFSIFHDEKRTSCFGRKIGGIPGKKN